MAAQTTSENDTSPDYEIVNEMNCQGYSDLPEDLVIDILLRLPVKSLIRFETVCKPWKLLFNSPFFMDNHLHSKTPQENLLLIWSDDGFKKDYNVSFKVKYSIGSCNGIICFRTDADASKPLVLFNPSTREHSFIPEECKADYYGFCYLSQTQEYKVLFFTVRRGVGKSFVDMIIWTLGMKTKPSREVKAITIPWWIGFRVAVCETCVVWMGCDLRNDIVVCYDAFEDRFSKIDVPPNPTNQLVDFSLGVLYNSVILFVYPFDATYFDMWNLIKDGSMGKTWIKFQKAGPSNPAVNMYPVHISLDQKRIICRKEEEGVIYKKDDCFSYWIDEIFYYDLETNQVIDYETSFPQVGILDFVRYVSTIVSLNCILRCKA